jgi:Helix-turn-helix domain
MTDAESGPAGAQASAAGIFAAELKAQRGRLGWTQVQLGERIGYSGSFISDVEGGPGGKPGPRAAVRQRDGPAGDAGADA